MIKATLGKERQELDALKAQGLELSQELQETKLQLSSALKKHKVLSQKISGLKSSINRLRAKSRHRHRRNKLSAPIIMSARTAYAELLSALTVFRWGAINVQLAKSVSGKELTKMCQQSKRAIRRLTL